MNTKIILGRLGYQIDVFGKLAPIFCEDFTVYLGFGIYSVLIFYTLMLVCSYHW